MTGLKEVSGWLGLVRLVLSGVLCARRASSVVQCAAFQRALSHILPCKLAAPVSSMCVLVTAMADLALAGRRLTQHEEWQQISTADCASFQPVNSNTQRLVACIPGLKCSL